MKIILVNDYGYQLGGAETHFFELAENLRSAHQVLTVTSDFCHLGKELISDRQISVSGNYFDLDRIFNLKNYFQFKKIIKNFKPDIIHFHNIFYQLSPSVIAASKGIPRIMTLHDYCLICDGQKVNTKSQICTQKLSQCKSCQVNPRETFVNQLRNYSARFFAKRIERFIAPSLYLKEQFENNNYKNIKLLPHFIKNSVIPEIDTKLSSENYFLYIGRLVKQKGIDIIISSMKDPRLLNYKLYIAGTGEEENSLRKLVSELNLENQIKFVGRVEGEEKARLLRNCLANLLPARWPEVAGLSIYEAATYGRPSIASNVGGIKDFIINGENGFLVNDLSVQTWSDVLALFNTSLNLTENNFSANLAASLQNQCPKQYLKQLNFLYNEN